MNTIFQNKPWHDRSNAVHGMPRGMLGSAEGALLYYLSRDLYQGSGADRIFGSGYHHWLHSGRREGRTLG